MKGIQNRTHNKNIYLRIKFYSVKIVNNLRLEVGEPHMIIEPSFWNNATTTDIRIIISSHYYIPIKQSQIYVLNKSNNMSIPFDECIDDLRYYFLDQVFIN